MEMVRVGTGAAVRHVSRDETCPGGDSALVRRTSVVGGAAAAGAASLRSEIAQQASASACETGPWLPWCASASSIGQWLPQQSRRASAEGFHPAQGAEACAASARAQTSVTRRAERRTTLG